MFKPTPDLTERARSIIARPDARNFSPQRAAWAWEVLKADRGQAVHSDTLPAASHHVATDPAQDPYFELRARIRARIISRKLPSRPDALILSDPGGTA